MRGALTLEGRQTAFLLLSMMDDVADDSVPLGVYSVPGLARPPPGWAGLSSQARAYVRQAVATAETRLAVGLFVANVLFALAEVAYAFSNASVDHLTDSLRTLSDCGAPAIALYGAIMPTWRANAAHPLGYGRYEVLCAFTNVLLLVLFAVAFASSALGTLMHFPEGRPSALPPPLFATLVRLAINAVALPAFYVLLSRDAQKRAAASPPLPLPSVGAGCARRLWEALRRWLSDPRANSNVQALLLHLAAGVFWSSADLLGLLLLPSGALSAGGSRSDASADPAHPAGPPAGAAALGALAAAAVSVAVAAPLLLDTAETLLQVTPRDVRPGIPMLRREISGVPGVSAILSLHVWRLSSRALVATANVRAAPAVDNAAAVPPWPGPPLRSEPWPTHRIQRWHEERTRDECHRDAQGPWATLREEHQRVRGAVMAALRALGATDIHVQVEWERAGGLSCGATGGAAGERAVRVERQIDEDARTAGGEAARRWEAKVRVTQAGEWGSAERLGGEAEADTPAEVALSATPPGSPGWSQAGWAPLCSGGGSAGRAGSVPGGVYGMEEIPL